MVHNIPDITPGGGSVSLTNNFSAATAHTRCNWLQVICPAGNSGVIRIGDSTTSATTGLALPAGSGFLFPPIADDLYIDLGGIFVFGTGSDKISIVYGSH